MHLRRTDKLTRTSDTTLYKGGNVVCTRVDVYTVHLLRALTGTKSCQYLF